MCVTSLLSLTQISLQVPSSPSSPKFYWARENEGRPQSEPTTAPRPSQQPTVLTFPGPTKETQTPVPFLGNGEWGSAWDTALLPHPQPAKLSGQAHEVTLHVSRWQRWVCEG